MDNEKKILSDLDALISQGKDNLLGFNAVKTDLLSQLGNLKNILPKEVKKEITQNKITKTLNDKRTITLEFLTQQDADKYFDTI